MCKIYLCGPIEGLKDQESKNWRDIVSFHFDTLDPTRRKPFSASSSLNEVNQLVTLDLKDIDTCDLVLGNLLSISAEVKGWGSLMELMYAAQKGKPIITILPKGVRHPFIEYVSTEIHHNLEAALEQVVEYAR